jgi:hypothetical protein
MGQKEKYYPKLTHVTMFLQKSSTEDTSRSPEKQLTVAKQRKQWCRQITIHLPTYENKEKESSK